MADDVKQDKPRSGKAALVWLLIFLFIGSLLIFRVPSGDKPRDLSQSEFETLLAQGAVRQAAVTPEANRVLVIEGKLAAPRIGKPGGTEQKDTVFRTRVLRSERMDAMLTKVPRMKVESGNDNWWALAISVLPVILVLIVIYIFTSRQIRMSGRGPGRPAKADKAKARQEARDETDRIEVERFFSREKRTCGAGLIVTRLKETTLASIALSVFVANLFGIPAGGFFVLYFLDLPETARKCHLCEFSGTAA